VDTLHPSSSVRLFSASEGWWPVPTARGQQQCQAVLVAAKMTDWTTASTHIPCGASVVV
jgi:hypothetical protein